jgi:hypothetical protein
MQRPAPPPPRARAHAHTRPAAPQFRAFIREFIDREIAPDAAANDEAGTHPTQELNLQMGAENVLACVIGSMGERLRELGFELPLGLAGKFDVFHELILAEEFKRFGCYGLGDGLIGGAVRGAAVQCAVLRCGVRCSGAVQRGQWARLWTLRSPRATCPRCPRRRLLPSRRTCRRTRRTRRARPDEARRCRAQGAGCSRVALAG